MGFTNGLGLYTSVYAYTDSKLEHILMDGDSDKDERRSEGGGKQWIYVDVAGNGQLNLQLQSYLAGLVLVKAVSLGMTNLSPVSGEGQRKEWRENTFSLGGSSSITNITTNIDSASTDSAGERGPREFTFEQFFMPEWLAVRRKQLSPLEIFERQNVAWHALMRDGQNWVKLERVRGAGEVKRAYEELVRDGVVGPEKGFVWSMFSEVEEKSEGSTTVSRL